MDTTNFTENHIKMIEKEFLQYIINEIQDDWFEISLETIYKLLNDMNTYESYLNNEKFREEFNLEYLTMLSEYKEDDRGCDFTMRNNNGIDIPWFSTNGFKHLCLLLNNDISKYLRRTFMEIYFTYMKCLEQTRHKHIEKLNIRDRNNDVLR